MKRHKVTVLLGVVALVSLLIVATASVVSGQKRVIRFADHADIEPADFLRLTNDFILEFEKENPNILVRFEPLIWPWVDKVTAQMAAGDAPDILDGWGDFFREWMLKDQTLPLDDYVDAEYLKDFYPQQLPFFYVKGSLRGIPKYVNVMALYYNKDMFDEAGLSYPDKSWD